MEGTSREKYPSDAYVYFSILRKYQFIRINLWEDMGSQTFFTILNCEFPARII